MTTTSEPAEYSIRVLISDWLLIDGTMDNHVQSAIDGSGQETTERQRVTRLGTSIRQAGWDQIPGWPHDAEGFQTWPAPGETATMTLTGAQWKLVILAMHYWADVDERLSDAKGAAKSRAIATVVGQRLAEQGWSPEAT